MTEPSAKLSKNQQILRFLTELEGRRLSRTRLLKAVFLADLQSRQRLGHPISSYEYKFHKHGPYTQQVQEDVDSLEAVGFLKEHMYMGRRGRGYYYTTHGEVGYPDLNEDEKLLLESIVIRCAEDSLDDLLERVYETEPMRIAASLGRGARIPMELFDTNTPEPVAVASEDISRSISELNAGRGRNLRDAMDDLRTRHFANG